MTIDFFVDLIITGTVLGVDHTSELADVEEALGRDQDAGNAWLSFRGREQAFRSYAEAAVNLIMALTEARNLSMADGFPTMDEAVERWLAATTTLANAARLCTNRPLDPADVRLSRRLRNQLHAIQPCLPSIASAVLAEPAAA
jgi:hypothetical protein